MFTSIFSFHFSYKSFFKHFKLFSYYQFKCMKTNHFDYNTLYITRDNYIIIINLSKNVETKVHQNVMDSNDFFSMNVSSLNTKHRIGTKQGGMKCIMLLIHSLSLRSKSLHFLTQVKKQVKRFLCCGTQNQIDMVLLLLQLKAFIRSRSCVQMYRYTTILVFTPFVLIQTKYHKPGLRTLT